MIWDKLFLQYKDKPTLYFGSKFLNFVGRLFIGHPKDIGLGNVHPELQRSYYYLRIDRFAPPSSKGIPGYSMERYTNENLRLTQYREAERKRIAKAVSHIAIVACLALIVSAGIIRKGAEGVKAVSNEVTQMVKGDSAGNSTNAAQQAKAQIMVNAPICQALTVKDSSEGLSAEENEMFQVCLAEYGTVVNEAMRAQVNGSEE